MVRKVPQAILANAIAVIIDTNTWLDWLLFNDGCTQLLKAQFREQRIYILATPEMRSELNEVLERPHIGLQFIGRSEFDSVGAIMAEFDKIVTLITAPLANKLLPQCKDGDDQIFIDAAFSSKAILITKDRLVLGLARQLKQRFNTVVMKPHQAGDYIFNLAR